MPADYLSQFRRQLFRWLERHLADGRTPFRRVEETPRILTSRGPASPDLVLWINRDSLLAGAVIFTPANADQPFLDDAAELATSLGLRQFVTWEARSVSLREIRQDELLLLKSWPLPDAGQVRAGDFSSIFGNLLIELKQRAVAAAVPAENLPATVFANLCRQTLEAIRPLLQENARAGAGSDQPDERSRRQARDQGWLTIWRLLVLLWHDRLPPRVHPERLDRALAYAIADLYPGGERHRLFLADGHQEPLPEPAAVRCHHLAGRLAQLGWPLQRQRALDTLALLVDEAARDCAMNTCADIEQARKCDLLVGYLPLPADRPALILPTPCLTGLAVLGELGGTPLGRPAGETCSNLPDNFTPRHIVARLVDGSVPPAAERRRRLTALRQPWPYRRFPLPAAAPTWLWDALHLGGLVDSSGELALSLPPGWPGAPGAGVLWSALTERMALSALTCHPDGSQTLHLCSLDTTDGDCLVRRHDAPEGQRLDSGAITLAALAAMGPTGHFSRPASDSRPERRSALPAAAIAAEVFRDGLPRFPQDYLRRIDLPPLRAYRLPGRLRQDAVFFDRIRLAGPEGAVIEVDKEATAEALILAAHDGRGQVALPIDPQLTAQLIAAYRNDLQRLWQSLNSACRRHQPRQRAALALARRLWREHGLPPPGPEA